MAIIEPERRDVEYPHLRKKYSSGLRLWHWINLLAILGSYLTATLLGTILDREESPVFIQQQLQKAGAMVSLEQANAPAQALRDEAWQVHVWCGYTLGILLLFRLALEFFHIADQKLLRKIKAAYNRYFVLKKDRKLARHELFVKSLYALFYLMILVMVITGLCLHFEDQVPALKKMHFIRNIHEINMYFILSFIIVHMVGVYLAERKESKGIVSDMINGGRN